MIGLTLICLFIAVDWAARTKPSNSAPLKFLVSTASSAMSTSSASSWCSRIRTVWIWRIWNLPFSSGKPEILNRAHASQSVSQHSSCSKTFPSLQWSCFQRLFLNISNSFISRIFKKNVWKYAVCPWHHPHTTQRNSLSLIYSKFIALRLPYQEFTIHKSNLVSLASLNTVPPCNFHKILLFSDISDYFPDCTLAT